MIRHVVVLLMLLSGTKGSWVKVANFYSPSPLHPLLSSLRKTNQDLVVVALDTDFQQVRIPLNEAPYYGLSRKWTDLNETRYFGRLSVFTQNYANQDVEQNIMRFQGNMTVTAGEYSVMSLVRNNQEFSGYLCNVGDLDHRKRTLVKICFHNVTEHANINTSQIKILVSKADCSDCPRHKVHPHKRGGSLEFGIPDSGGREKWNITIQYSQHTTLCRFEKELSPDLLNVVIMKQNLSVSTMLECVLFSEQPLSDPMEMWTPIIAGLVSVVVLATAVTVLYYKCDRACLRQLIPAPDQDRAAAPYRSFNSSNARDSPVVNSPGSRCIKMREFSSKSGEWSNHGNHGKSGEWSTGPYSDSKLSEPHYERI